MGKIIDFLLTENWEEYKRVQLYKKLGKAVENLPQKQFKEIEEEKRGQRVKDIFGRIWVIKKVGRKKGKYVLEK